MLWVRNLAKFLASEGRTVFLSSHLMSEVAQTADRVLVIGRGKILADASVQEFVDGSSQKSVKVRSPQAAQLAELVTGDGVTVTSSEPGLLDVAGSDAASIGETAAANGIVLHELTPVTSTLEQAYMELTAESVEYHATGAPDGTTRPDDAAVPAPTSTEGAAR